MDFTIRPATLEDAPAIAHVHVESWRTTYVGIVPADYLAALDVEQRRQAWQEVFATDNLLLFVAEDSRGVFGFIRGGKLREPREGVPARYDGELYAIYLLADRQTSGAGRALVEALAASLKGSGFTSMVVWALEQNPAVGFYQHLGATIVLRKMVNIGGAELPDVALAWPDITLLAP